MTSRLSRAIWPLLQRSRAAASPAAFSTRLYASEAASAAPAFGSASTSSSAQSSSSTKQPTRIPRNLLQPGAKVSKRPHRERPPNPGLGARVPRAPVPDVSQPVYLPNFKIVLCRNGPAHADDPYTATFRVPMSLTKPDIVSFLTQAYGLSITGIRTLIYRGEVVKMFHPGLSRRKGPGRKPGYKKAIIQMTQPFWYPERPSEDWLEQKFALAEHDVVLRKRQLELGNMEKPNYDRREKRFRGASPTFVGMGARGKLIKDQQGRKRNSEERLIEKLGEEEAGRMGKA